jgi:anaerobic selenocysteine-containing dehydrogenase
MSENSRRKFLASSVALAAGSTVFAATNAIAGSHGGHGEGMGMKIDAATKDVCATCQFWGGMRKASKDKSTVTAQSMGWCNNPDSMSYQKLTNADKKMKKTGIWQKWSAL